MTRLVSDVLRIMRLATGRRNENDPDSDDDTFLSYINDFSSLTMGNDVKLFEQYGTMSFDIDGSTDGVYNFPSASTSVDFTNLSQEVMITLKNPDRESVSWQPLCVYLDPGTFYGKWGINNEDILVTGFPNDMLFYGNELVFRTIPDTDYTIKIYGYKRNPDFSAPTDELAFDDWMRYLAYGAAKEYGTDYRLDEANMANIDRELARQRKLLLTKTHNHLTIGRGYPRF